MPAPWLGVHVSPSSSLKDMRLVAPASCEVKVRPVRWSVKRIGSRLVTAFGALLSSQVVLAGEEVSSNVTRNVWVFDWKKTLPVLD